MRSRLYRDLTPLHEWPDLNDQAAAVSQPMEPADANIYRLLTRTRQDGGIVVDALRVAIENLPET